MKNKTLMKTLSALLAVVMVLCSAPLSGFVGLKFPGIKLADLFDLGVKAETANYSGTCGDNVNWSLNVETGVLNITGVGEMYNYEDSSLQSTINTPWYDYKSFIKIVNVSDGVKTIGDSAFYSCKNLLSITIPKSVVSVGSYVFDFCDNFCNVYYLGDIASWCVVSFSDGGTSNPIGCVENFYIGGTILEGHLVIPNTVSEIKNSAFSNYDRIISVTIPNSVMSIGNEAFSFCSELTTVKIGDNVTAIGSDAFYLCDKLASIMFGDNVTSIGSYAFEHCSNLSVIKLPNAIKNIGFCAFRYCTNLKDVYYDGSKEQWDEVTVAEENGCLLNSSIYFIENSNASEKYIYSIKNEEALVSGYVGTEQTVKIPPILGGYAVTSIGNGAFANSTNVISVAFPDTVTTVGSDAFRGCANLTSVCLPKGITNIGSCAFYGCSALSEITIPNTVERIGYSAFQNTALYNDLNNWENSVLYIDGYLIEAKESISGEYKVRSDTKIIADYAFELCVNLTSIEIADGVKSIGRCTFMCCDSLTNVIIPESVIKIDTDAFVFCEEIEAIYYEGTEEDWKKVEIIEKNEYLLNSNIIFLGDNKPETGVCLSGKIQSNGDSTGVLTVELRKIADKNFLRTQTLTGLTAQYQFEELEQGDYIVTISKENHVTRNYMITIGTYDAVLPITIHLKGDVDGDGKVTLVDYSATIRHVKKISIIDDYLFSCADVDENGKITVIDYAKILRHVKKTEMLW